MKTIDVVAAVLVDDGRILATQRGYGEFEGKWEFPGGKIEPGETPEEALVREIHEEMAAGITVERSLCTVQYDYPKFHLNMQCFVCSLASAFELLEHHAAKWVGAADIDTLDWLPADDEVIQAIKEEKLV